jgi:putative oxidoreductase
MEFKLLSETEAQPKSQGAMGDWALRLVVCAVFIIIGLEKFQNSRGSQWIAVFRHIGWGDWFRYFTGVVEVLGGLLVLIPRACLAGLLLLACTMAGALLAHLVVLHDGAVAILPALLLAGLLLMAALRWRNAHED